MGDPIVPSGTCGNIPYRYNAFVFTHGGGALSLAARGASSGGGTLLDPYLWLFPGEGLPPGNPCVDVLEFYDDDDESGCGSDAYLEVTKPAGTYTAVVLEFSNSTGTYTFERNTFTGAEVCP